MKKQIFIGVLSVVIVALVLAAVKYFQFSAAMAKMQHQGVPPQAVTTAIAKEETWFDMIEAVGSLAAVQGVTLSAEEAGRVIAIYVDSGVRVEKGQPLVDLDISVEQAKLASVRAQEELARRNYSRAQSLKNTDVLSRQELDTAESALKQAQAEAASLEATIARKHIIAPFSGKVGIRQVNIGQYVTPGTEILPLHVTDPLYVNFSVPQQDSYKISPNAVVEVTVDASPEKVLGKVNAINPQVDSSTRNVSVQATIPNANELLKAGMFAKVNVILETSQKVIVVPVSSVNYASYGDTVFIAEKQPEQKLPIVRQQVVKTGARRGDEVAILEGVKASDEVVSSGLFKLKPGFPLIIRNDLAPGVSANPLPQDN